MSLANDGSRLGQLCVVSGRVVHMPRTLASPAPATCRPLLHSSFALFRLSLGVSLFVMLETLRVASVSEVSLSRRAIDLCIAVQDNADNGHFRLGRLLERVLGPRVQEVPGPHTAKSILVVLGSVASSTDGPRKSPCVKQNAVQPGCVPVHPSSVPPEPSLGSTS